MGNKIKLTLIISLAYAMTAFPTKAASETKAKVEIEEHGEEHGEHGDHESSAEENPSVGPGKGIVAVDEHLGFKLSDAAFKKFKVTTTPAIIGASMTLPKSAIFYGLQERNLFRIRKGFFKRVDFDLKSKSASQVTVLSNELEPGDLIVVTGIGFLRIAEIASTGGGAVGHSH
jgi:hypothetical protein